jgi:diacylglycerol kinase (ATP)
VMLPFLRFGRHELWRGIQHRRGQNFQVSTRRPMRVNTDGELTTTTPAQFSVKPKALPVLVPNPTESSENT